MMTMMCSSASADHDDHLHIGRYPTRGWMEKISCTSALPRVVPIEARTPANCNRERERERERERGREREREREREGEGEKEP